MDQEALEKETMKWDDRYAGADESRTCRIASATP
jgi:hypothetical protein